ncbi:MAG: YdcF family protein [Geminicoccaceae bacterium]
MIAVAARVTGRPASRVLRGLATLLLCSLVALGLGFGWFLHAATRSVEPPASADGIVALTGGADRVGTALHLLAQGRARVLLLSGIGGGAELPNLAHRAGLDPAPLIARVTLGRQATTTRGNAAETAAWARQNDIRTLMVVTAGYHMPRAMTELSRALPGVRLFPVPVTPRAMQVGLRDFATLRLMVEEYGKWVLAQFGLLPAGQQREAVARLGPTRPWAGGAARAGTA